MISRHRLWVRILRALIPRNKHDLRRARVLVALGYPAVAPVLPELLEWLQDLNWPVEDEDAHEVADEAREILLKMDAGPAKY